MRKICQRCPPTVEPDDVLELDFDTREKSRVRVRSESGDEVGIFLERGTTLRDGDCLVSDDGRVFRVTAKAEPVSLVSVPHGFELARLAYHLGNRHVRLQIGIDSERPNLEPQAFIRYQPDHVLDDLVTKFGFRVTHVSLPFEPEPGAYHSGGHAHPHSHDTSDGRSHSHARFSPLEPGGLIRRVP
jgi:urease accessory protein